MSEISREIKVLYYLKEHQNRLVKSNELASYLEVSKRQIRRYINDLICANFDISSLTGLNGGYKLECKIDDTLSMSETECIMLNLALNSNDNLISHLNEALSISSKIKKSLVLNNSIENYELDQMTIITKAMSESKNISFNYIIHDNKIIEVIVSPYIFITFHHTYYLRAINNNMMKSYDISMISNIKILEEKYILNDNLYQREIMDAKECYGIYRFDDKTPIEIELKINPSTKQDILRYFDNKGSYIDNLYKVKCYNLKEILPAILSLGSMVERIKPAELYYLYKEEINKMIK